MNNPRAKWIFWAALVVLLVGGTLLAMWRRDIQVEPPEVFGRVWTTADASPAVLVYVTREERSLSIRGVGRNASYRSEPYERFLLEVRRVDNGARLSALPLGDFKEIQEAVAPQILGLVGDVVWLWRDGPEARALPSLEVRCDATRLQQTSPAIAAFLPTEPKGYAVMPEPRTFLMRGRDARLYAIDPAAAEFTPLAPEQLPPSNNTTRAEDRFNYLRAPGQSRSATSPDGFLQRSFLTRTGQWYALLSESERAGLSPWPSGEDRPFGAVARAFYRAEYKMEGAHPAIVPAAVAPVGDVRLIQAGFIVRTGNTVWDVPDPSSTLVLAKPLLGDTEPWEVVRLARDGSIVWRTSTELADPDEMLDAQTHAIFIGRRVARGSGPTQGSDTRERIVSLDTRTGVRRTLFVATGDLEPPVEP